MVVVPSTIPGYVCRVCRGQTVKGLGWWVGRLGGFAWWWVGQLVAAVGGCRIGAPVLLRF